MSGLALLLLCASPMPLRVASAGIEGVGVDAKLLSLLGDEVAHQLSSGGRVAVVTPGDITAVLGVERQRQLLGCSGESNCVVELAGALGVRYVLAGDVARIGNHFSVTLKMLDATTGFALFAKEARASNEEGLIPVVTQLAQLLRGFIENLRPAPVVQPAPVVTAVTPTVASRVERRFNWLPVIPTLVGVGLAAGGTVFLFKANAQLGSLTALADAPSTPDALTLGTALRDEGKRNGTFAAAFFGAAGAAVLAGLLWWGVAPSHDVTVALIPSSGGAALGLAGAMP